MTTETTDDEKATRPFAAFLQDHNRGSAHTEASEALQRLVLAAADTGKAGSVTVKVSVKPMDGSETAMVTTVEVTEKLPKVPLRPAIFYADDDGNLTRDDPQSLPFPKLKEVDGPKVRDVAPAAEAKTVGGDA